MHHSCACMFTCTYMNIQKAKETLYVEREKERERVSSIGTQNILEQGPVVRKDEEGKEIEALAKLRGNRKLQVRPGRQGLKPNLCRAAVSNYC